MSARWSNSNSNLATDSAELASRVRRLARSAHRFLKDPGHPVEPGEAHRLIAQLERIRLTLGEDPSGGLELWLDNLQRELEEVEAGSELACR